MHKTLYTYVVDVIYGATRFPMGWVKPKVVRGYFPTTEAGHLQKVFFKELLGLGFRRTFWQLIFPDQIAGVIKTVPMTESGANQFHIRFYEDGVIDCEFEMSRFNVLHWRGIRIQDESLLEEFLAHMNLSFEMKDALRSLFGKKAYAELCIRGWQGQESATF